MNGDTSGGTPNYFVSQIDDRSTVVGKRVAQAAGEIRALGDQFRDTPVVAQFASLTDRGAAYVDTVAAYLQEGDTKRFVSDLETLTRRNPWAVTGGAVIVGFMASRFLKTSASGRSLDPTSRTNTTQMTAHAAEPTDA